MKYPWILLICLFCFIAMVIVAIIRSRKNSHKKTTNKTNYKKLANTKNIRSLPEYKAAEQKYHLLLLAVFILFITIFSTMSVIAARPVSTSVTKPEYDNRDIMLCLDASGSMDVHIEALLHYFNELLPNFQGQRVGLTAFNAFYLTLAPLSDDYDALADVFTTMEENATEYASALASSKLDPSMIGQGLVGCVKSFDKLDEDRSRSIILATDNDPAGVEKIDITQAANYAKRYNIVVYGLSTDDYRNQNEIDNPNNGSNSNYEKENWKKYREAVLSTGGTYYAYSAWNGSQTMSIEDIVQQIFKESAARYEGTETIVQTDAPLIPIIIAIVGLIAFFAIIWRLSL